MKQLHKIMTGDDVYGYAFHCPGCDDPHVYPIERPGQKVFWEFNGNEEIPTFTPSLTTGGPRGPAFVCHLNMTEGKLVFHADCSHDLRGQTVPIPVWDHAWP